MNREAWFCPACQKHHAPHVDTCPSISEGTYRKTGGPLDGIKPVTLPQPIWTAPTTGTPPSLNWSTTLVGINPNVSTCIGIGHCIN